MTPEELVLAIIDADLREMPRDDIIAIARRALDERARAERARCAEIADAAIIDETGRHQDNGIYRLAAKRIAAAIRVPD